MDGLHLKYEQIIVGSGNITWTLGLALLVAAKYSSTNGILGIADHDHPGMIYIYCSFVEVSLSD
jgi:hypothetical protein